MTSAARDAARLVGSGSLDKDRSCDGEITSLLWRFLGTGRSEHVCGHSLQSRPTPCDPRDSGPPGSSVPGLLQARMLGWGASRGSPRPRG